jgi:hypothetical protein
VFVTEYKVKVDVPGTPDEWVEIRPLSWLELAHEQEKAFLDVAKAAAAIDVKAVFGESSPEDVAAAQERYEADALSGHDMLAVLVAGITAWSSDEPVTQDAIKMLEPELAESLARQIIGLRTKDELGNSCSPSTDTLQA